MAINSTFRVVGELKELFQQMPYIKECSTIHFCFCRTAPAITG